VHVVNLSGSCNSNNMRTRDLPDMYTQSPMATGPRVEGIHNKQIMSAHVTSNMYHFRSMGKLIVLSFKTEITIEYYKLL